MMGAMPDQRLRPIERRVLALKKAGVPDKMLTSIIFALHLGQAGRANLGGKTRGEERGAVGVRCWGPDPPAALSISGVGNDESARFLRCVARNSRSA